MKTRALALALPALLAAACAADYNAVALTNVCFPPAPTSGVCSYSATCDANLANTAWIDVGVAPGPMELPVEFTNQLASSANESSGTVNVNDAFVQQIEMEYVGAPLAPLTLPVQATVPSAGATVKVLQLIQTADFATLQAQLPTPASTLKLIVKVRASGIFGSQNKFTTAWFQIPVDVYAGLLPPTPVCPAGESYSACPQYGQTNQAKCE